jgi:hypothetical protein
MICTSVACSCTWPTKLSSVLREAASIRICSHSVGNALRAVLEASMYVDDMLTFSDIQPLSRAVVVTLLWKQTLAVEFHEHPDQTLVRCLLQSQRAPSNGWRWEDQKSVSTTEAIKVSLSVVNESWRKMHREQVLGQWICISYQPIRPARDKGFWCNPFLSLQALSFPYPCI